MVFSFGPGHTSTISARLWAVLWRLGFAFGMTFWHIAVASISPASWMVVTGGDRCDHLSQIVVVCFCISKIFGEWLLG